MSVYIMYASRCVKFYHRLLGKGWEWVSLISDKKRQEPTRSVKNRQEASRKRQEASRKRQEMELASRKIKFMSFVYYA